MYNDVYVVGWDLPVKTVYMVIVYNHSLNLYMGDILRK